MKRKFFIIGIALMGLTSCKSISEAYERWHKFGVKKIEVKKALLECGAPTPFYYYNGRLRNDLNALASIHLCMVESGFRYNDSINWCRDRPEGKLAVCNGPIPARSVSRRLDSYYCKYGTGVPVCITTTAQGGLEACKRKENDPPLAECLP